jgi:hypothetical protein
MKNLQGLKELINLNYIRLMTLFSKLGFKIFLFTIILYTILQSQIVLISGVVLYILVCLNRAINIYNDKIKYEYFSKDVVDMLDKLIQDTLTEYILLNRAYEKTIYINSDEENKIRSEVSDMVVTRLSPTLKNKLALYYNEYSISYILANKIYMAVLAYVLQNNKEEKLSKNTQANKNEKINITDLLKGRNGF